MKRVTAKELKIGDVVRITPLAEKKFGIVKKIELSDDSLGCCFVFFSNIDMFIFANTDERFFNKISKDKADLIRLGQ